MDHIAAAVAGHESPQATVSKFHVYSYGLAAENKALNSFELEVTPIEDLPMVDGELSTNANQAQTQGTDLTGQQYQTQMTSSGTVKATWLPVGQANRLTAPDVRRGEEVILYRFGDTDKYYWNTTRNDLRFRKLETVVFGISATQDEKATPGLDNSYYIEFSSHKKSITLITTKANGEPFAYSFQFDTGNGKVELKDDIGNTIFVDSQQHQIHMENADGSFFDITKFAMAGFARDTIDFKTKAYSVEASDSISLQTKAYTLDASSTITEETQARSMTAETDTVTAETTHNGNIGLSGDLATTAGHGGSGNVKMGGDMQIDGTITAEHLDVQSITSTGDITAPNLKYN